LIRGKGGKRGAGPFGGGKIEKWTNLEGSIYFPERISQPRRRDSFDKTRRVNPKGRVGFRLALSKTREGGERAREQSHKRKVSRELKGCGRGN